MKNKICVVCGGTSGIGFETCRGLARAGAQVILTGTTQARAEQAAKALPGNCRGLALDLTDFDSVRGFANRLLAEIDQLDVLIHNAGLVLPKRRTNPQGIEVTFAVVYLGPFLLTQLLMPLIETGPKTRIVNVASDLHRRARLDFDDLQCEKRYNFVRVYAKAELAKVLWTRTLARKLSTEQATVNSLHPGGVRTRIFRHFRGPLGWLLALSGLLKMSAARGAKTSVYLATSPEVESATGGYFVKCRPTKVAQAATDEAAAGELWNTSLDLIECVQKIA